MRAAALIFLTLLVAVARGGDDPTTQRTVIDASDRATIDKNLGQTVIIAGKVKTAAWSQSGKVMNIEFENSDVLAVIFENDRKKMDDAFSGDVAKALDGATVRITGKLETYGGKAKEFEGRPQIIIGYTNLITIMEPGNKE